MNSLGFNFTKISAEREPVINVGTISTNIEFLDITKGSIDILKDSEVLKISFRFKISYESGKKEKPQAQIIFEGILLVSVEKEKAKEILRLWKKKETPGEFRISLYNLILNKCSIKALSLEEEMVLPTHFPIPLRVGENK